MNIFMSMYLYLSVILVALDRSSAFAELFYMAEVSTKIKCCPEIHYKGNQIQKAL